MPRVSSLVRLFLLIYSRLPAHPGIPRHTPAHPGIPRHTPQEAMGQIKESIDVYRSILQTEPRNMIVLNAMCRSLLMEVAFV